MKKIILCLSAIISLSVSSALAQGNGIEIHLDGVGADISGGAHTVNLTAASPEIATGTLEVKFLVTNNTGTDQQWKITRKSISAPATWVDYICWPPQCYTATGTLYATPNTGGNPAPVIVNGTATTTSSEVAELKPRVTPDQSLSGSAMYRYYITAAAGGAYVDSIDLNVSFVLSIPTLKQTPSLNVSPNPADDYVNIALANGENSSVRIVDVLGNIVYNETIGNGTKNIDVSNFKNGVYFILIQGSGMKSINRKLIIRH